MSLWIFECSTLSPWNLLKGGMIFSPNSIASPHLKFGSVWEWNTLDQDSPFLLQGSWEEEVSHLGMAWEGNHDQRVSPERELCPTGCQWSQAGAQAPCTWYHTWNLLGENISHFVENISTQNRCFFHLCWHSSCTQPFCPLILWSRISVQALS